jgi:tryptophan synthase alpha chain
MGLHAIESMFEAAKAEGRAAFLPFVMIGYPSIEDSIETVIEMAALGADGFEIGVPFSDPLADGPTVQHASQHALEQAVTVQTGLDAIRTLRERGVKQPLLMFSYINPLLAYGPDVFAEALQQAGGDGLICPDLPPEEGHLFAGLPQRDLAQVYFLAPTSNDSRIDLVGQQATGFIYAVSVTGITGAREQLPADLTEYIARLRARTSIPLVMGFGISTPEQAVRLNGLLDGFIVASALIKLAPQGRDKVVALAASIRAALSPVS